jgi:FkbM family methyltransferase
MKIREMLTSGVAEARGHHFIGRGLGRKSAVIDLGANRGDFARKIESRWGALCICVEPNPALCAMWSGPNGVINAAISASNGETGFFISANSEGSSIYEHGATEESISVHTLTLESLMQQVGIAQADLVKLDVEGAEIEVLMQVSDATLKRLRQVTVEFHDFAVPHITAEDVARVKSRMDEAGFWSISFSARNTDVLFINRSAGVLGPLEYYWVAYVVRNVLGLGRRLRRWVGG